MFVISDHTLVKCEGEAEDRGCCPFWRKRQKTRLTLRGMKMGEWSDFEEQNRYDPEGDTSE